MLASTDHPTSMVGGRLPSGWQWARLGDVARYHNGRAFRPDEWRNTGLPIVRIQNLTSPEARFNHFQGQLSEAHRADHGDLLISWSASLDAYIWRGGPAAVNQHIFKVEEDQSVIRREYLYFAVRAVMSEIREQVHGATMRHITRPEFERVQIPLPPLSVQDMIVGDLKQKLGLADAAGAAALAQLEAARALPAACLQAVYSSSESWPSRPLGDVSEFLPARSLQTLGDTEVRAITTACLTEHGFNPVGVKQGRMSADDAAVCAVSPGEVLIARSNTEEFVGRASLYLGDPPGIVATDLTIRVLPQPQIDAQFLAGYLSSLMVRGYWRTRASGASPSMKKITRTQLSATAIPVPDMDEQFRVRERLSEMLEIARNAMHAAEAQLAELDTLPAVILRQAFTGAL